jgi:general L-amino acid transport system permease protein
MKKILPQVITLIIIILVFGFFTFNANVNMSNRGMEFGYSFLDRTAGFDIQFSLIEYSRASTYGRAYLVGLLNTLLVAFSGIIFATILGLIFGIARLSKNLLISKFAAFYVEFFRNLPLLLQLFFWYYAALRILPMPNETQGFYNFYMTIKSLYTPSLVWKNLNVFLYLFGFSIILVVLIKKYFKKIQENQGKQYPVLLISLLILIFIPTLSFIFGGSSFEIEYPVLKKLSQSSYTFVGGLAIPPEFIALFLALSLYTGAFIAECVRAGIEGISKGQKEAAASIGLSQKQILNLVVLPQALRIIIPPTTNQYLNLTKNSSLAAAIAYPDVVLVFAGTALMQTGRAIEIVSITMLTYLSISLSISAFMNYYNKKVAITEK